MKVAEWRARTEAPGHSNDSHPCETTPLHLMTMAWWNPVEPSSGGRALSGDSEEGCSRSDGTKRGCAGNITSVRAKNSHQIGRMV